MFFCECCYISIDKNFINYCIANSTQSRLFTNNTRTMSKSVSCPQILQLLCHLTGSSIKIKSNLSSLAMIQPIVQLTEVPIDDALANTQELLN